MKPSAPITRHPHPHSLRRLLCGTVVLALAGLAPGRGLAATTNRPPNIVIFLSDDMGYGHQNRYGGKLAPTPNLDSIGANGVRFTQGYVSACVCSPSRVGLMTGRYQARSGHDNLTTPRPETQLDARERLMGQYFQKAGYVTGAFGKWHLGKEAGYRPTERGFDWYLGPMTNKNEVANYFLATSEIAKPDMDSPTFAHQAEAFIEANRHRPFLLYLPFTAIHAPHEASEGYLKSYDYYTERGKLLYAAMTAELDDAVGVVLQKLRSSGLEESTLVFQLSDNGGEGVLGENHPLRGAKWSLLEGGIRVPFAVQWKGRIPAGRVLDQMVIQLDVLPTLLAAAGLAPAKDIPLDGLNLLPLLTGQTDRLPRDTLYWRYPPQFAVRQGDWKLVKHEANQPPELFNLAQDIGETTDRSRQEPAKAAELLALYQQWDASMVPARWLDPRAGGLETRKQVLQARKKGGKKKQGG